ncbi:MAG: hypothetical protein V3S41_08445, partial [Spirochaetia bacterium]
AFALIVLIPVFVLGWEYSQVFWRGNWPAAIVFAAVLGGLNTYFGINWRLFTLLEREDWQGLIEHLEQKILVKNRLGKQRLRVLINSYVVTGASDKITELEIRLRDIDPAWVSRFPLEFGIPHLMKNDAPAMERFFGEMKERSSCPEPVWVRWNYGFALILQQKLDEARAVLMSIADEAKNPVQQLLTAYLLDSVSVHDESVQSVVNRLRSALQSRYKGDRWERELERHRSGLQVLVLSKLIGDASRWAFGPGEA